MVFNYKSGVIGTSTCINVPLTETLYHGRFRSCGLLHQRNGFKLEMSFPAVNPCVVVYCVILNHMTRHVLVWIFGCWFQRLQSHVGFAMVETVLSVCDELGRKLDKSSVVRESPQICWWKVAARTKEPSKWKRRAEKKTTVTGEPALTV